MRLSTKDDLKQRRIDQYNTEHTAKEDEAGFDKVKIPEEYCPEKEYRMDKGKNHESRVKLRVFNGNDVDHVVLLHGCQVGNA